MSVKTVNGLAGSSIKTILGLGGASISSFNGLSYFSPPYIANLSLWLDASDASTITSSSGLVSQWNDKSGNGNNATQGTGVNKPTTGTRTLNGKNVIDFDGTNSRLTLPAGLFGVSAGPNTIFVVFASDNTGSASQALVGGHTGGGGARYTVGFTATDLTVQNRSASASYTLQADSRNTNTKIVGFRRSGTSITPFVNGVQGSAGTNSENYTMAGMVIGSYNQFGSDPFNGVMAGIIIYADSLTDSQTNQVGGYLAGEWAGAWTGI